jgi:hypothetical protein
MKIILLLVIASLFFGCAKSSDPSQKNRIKKTEQSVQDDPNEKKDPDEKKGVIPPRIPGEEVDAARNHANKITGHWTVRSISSTRTDANSAFFQKLFQDQNQVELKVDEDPKDPGLATLHLILTNNRSSPPCTFTLDVDLIYCCERMRKITVIPNAQTAQESTLGCSQTSFGKSPSELAQILGGTASEAGSLEVTYHFNFYKGHLNLRGPFPPEDDAFEGPYDEPVSEIRLIQFKK